MIRRSLAALDCVVIGLFLSCVAVFFLPLFTRVSCLGLVCVCININSQTRFPPPSQKRFSLPSAIFQ